MTEWIVFCIVANCIPAPVLIAVIAITVVVIIIDKR